MNHLIGRKHESTFPVTSWFETSESSQEKYGRSVRPEYEDAIISRALRDSPEWRIKKFRVFRAIPDFGTKSGGSIYIIDNNNYIYHGRCTVRQMYKASSWRNRDGGIGRSAFWSFHHSHGENFDHGSA
jgi:hypothetical protein